MEIQRSKSMSEPVRIIGLILLAITVLYWILG